MVSNDSVIVEEGLDPAVGRDLQSRGHNVGQVTGYNRVSTDAQERDETSLNTQEKACLEYAEAQGIRTPDPLLAKPSEAFCRL